MRKSRILLPSLLATVLLCAPAASSGSAPQETDYTSFDTLDGERVNVEVIVTDPDGEPVRGLTAEEFELTEDGRPVEIESFYPVEERAAPGPAPAPGTEAAEPTPPPLEQRLQLAIFVDATTLEPGGRRRVFEAIRELVDLEEARPSSVILASYDGSLEITTLEAADAAGLDARLSVLDRAASSDATGQASPGDLLGRLDRAPLDPEVAEAEAEEVLGAIQAYAARRYGEAVRSLEALEGVVEALAGMPGRKAVLHVSGGVPRHPGEALFTAWESRFGVYARGLGVDVTQESRRFDTTPEVDRLIRLANASRVTFYAAVGAEEGSPDPSRTAGLVSTDRAATGGTLQEMAAATGGLATTSSRDLGNLLADLNRDLGSYYSLGYTPDRERDGASHRLEVRLPGRSSELRHREQYRERTREEIMGGRTRAAVLLGSQDNPLEVAMEFGQLAEQEDKVLLPVTVKVPLGKLVLMPQEDVHVGRIGIFICARDSRGHTSPVQSIDVPIRIPNDKLLTALGQVAGYRMTLLMRPEEHSVAVGVRDELGRVESTVTSPWSPPAPAS